MTKPSAIEENRPGSSTWPNVFGVFSILYASGGLLWATGQGVYFAVLPKLPAMFRAGMEVPLLVRVPALVMAAAALVLGILLLVGGIKLVRRRRSGVRLCKRWVILRLMLLIAGMTVTVLTGPAQLEIQRSVFEFRNQMLAERGSSRRIEVPDEQGLWHRVIVPAAVMTGVLAFYPTVLGFWLSRRKVAEEMEAWT